MHVYRMINVINQHPGLVARIGHILPLLRIYQVEDISHYPFGLPVELFLNDKGKLESDRKKIDENLDQYYRSAELNLPFDVISIESTQPLLTYVDPDSDNTSHMVCVLLVKRETGEIDILEFWETHRLGYRIRQQVYLYAAENPTSFQVFSKAGYRPHTELNTPDTAAKKMALRALSKSHRVAEEKTKSRIMPVQTHTGRILSMVSTIIRVYPSTQYTNPSATVGWQNACNYRFEVGGHWRLIKGIGLDRHGMRCIPGKTWVPNYVKGSPEKPLIVKTRIIVTPFS